MAHEKAPKPNRRELFDLAWHEWQDCPDGPRKQRLLNALVKSQTPLVQKFVSRLLRHTTVFVDVEDAMQAGMMGLFTALKKYDPKRPTQFSTMTWPWVRHEVSNMLQHQTQLYRPKGAGMPYREHRKSEAIEARTGRDATASELDVTEVQLAKWKAAAFKLIPMNEAKAGGEDGAGLTTRADAFYDAAPAADEQLDEARLMHRVRMAVKRLTVVERRILVDEDFFLPKPLCEAIRGRALRRLKLFLGE